MTHRRLYSTAVVAGILLAAGLAFWRQSDGAGSGEILFWAAGGMATALLLAFLADIGLRLQHRDVPAPRSADEPGSRPAGRLDNE